MKIWAYYRDGLYTGDSVRSSSQPAERPGCELLEVSQLPAPPRPPDTAAHTWAWSTTAAVWERTPTTAELARVARAERDALMAAADWVTLRAVRTGQPMPAAWATYLQALADVPAQAGFPVAITWPVPPQS
jgi:hypothetical protein